MIIVHYVLPNEVALFKTKVYLLDCIISTHIFGYILYTSNFQKCYNLVVADSDELVKKRAVWKAPNSHRGYQNLEREIAEPQIL